MANNFGHCELSIIRTDHLAQLRDVIIRDPGALAKWLLVLGVLIKSEPDKLRIKNLWKEWKYEEAIQDTLQLWYGYGSSRADLLATFRNLGWNALADNIQRMNWCARTQNRTCNVWFEVGSVVENFVGRETDIKALHDKLIVNHETDRTSAIYITGLGGIGKSALVIKYAFKYSASHYDGNVLWINGGSLALMRSSFKRLARHLSLQFKRKTPHQELARLVYEHFKDAKCLFIFDNLEEKSHYMQFQHNISNASHSVPYVLVTSRRNELAKIPTNQLTLGELGTGETVDFIRLHLPDCAYEDASDLAYNLQGHPLALQQAVSYSKARYLDGKGVSKYLTEFSQSQPDLLQDESFREENPYSKTTTATLGITLRKIQEESKGETTMKLLRVLSEKDGNSKTLEFLNKLFGDETEPSLKLLQKYSIISVSAEGQIQIHRLVQKVVRVFLRQAVNSPGAKSKSYPILKGLANCVRILSVIIAIILAIAIISIGLLMLVRQPKNEAARAENAATFNVFPIEGVQIIMAILGSEFGVNQIADRLAMLALASIVNSSFELSDSSKYAVIKPLLQIKLTAEENEFVMDVKFGRNVITGRVEKVGKSAEHYQYISHKWMKLLENVRADDTS